jgi:hypothetical protein
LPRWLIASLSLATLGVALGGCGGGGASYALDDTVSCLQGNGISVSTDEDDLDFVAQDAGEGALEAEIGENTVTVAFERSENDAKRTEAAYKIFAGALDTPVEDILNRRGNAVVAWENTPSDFESSQLDDCLSG